MSGELWGCNAARDIGFRETGMICPVQSGTWADNSVDREGVNERQPLAQVFSRPSRIRPHRIVVRTSIGRRMKRSMMSHVMPMASMPTTIRAD